MVGFFKKEAETLGFTDGAHNDSAPEKRIPC